MALLADSELDRFANPLFPGPPPNVGHTSRKKNEIRSYFCAIDFLPMRLTELQSGSEKSVGFQKRGRTGNRSTKEKLASF